MAKFIMKLPISKEMFYFQYCVNRNLKEYFLHINRLNGHEWMQIEYTAIRSNH